MKELPKYFVIKRVENNPLWDKYIKWLVETYRNYWEGDVNAYYGYDGKEVTWNNDISSFSNNPTELTLEEWDEMVNGFTLPNKWCIKNSPTIEPIISEWFNENIGRIPADTGKNSYWHYPEVEEFLSSTSSVKSGYTEITIEQFKKYVLKETNEMKKYSINDLKTNSKLIVFIETKEQFDKLVEHCGNFVSRHYGPYCYSIYERSYSTTSSEVNVGGYDSDSIIVKFNEIDFMEKKIIGYRLTKKEMYKAASYILYGNSAGSGHLDDVIPEHRANDLRKAGVLDLWFEPVYEEERFKVGDWIYIIDTGSSISGKLDDTQEYHHGALEGDVVQIKGITFKNGNASKDDPRYYGNNFNLRAEGFRKATPEEIAKYSKPDITIKGYKAEFTKDTVSFGCQTYSKDFVITLAKCLEDNGFDMEIKEEVLQIAKYFKNN